MSGMYERTKDNLKKVTTYHHLIKWAKIVAIVIVLCILSMVKGCYYGKSHYPEARIYAQHQRDTVVVDGTLYELALESIKKSEGMMLSPYMDSAGYYYIGYGHQIQGHEKALMNGISKHMADSLIKNDMLFFLQSVRRHTGAEGGELLAMSMLMYTMGEDLFLKSTVYYLYVRGEKKKARDAFILYDTAGGKKVSSLTKRRKFEMELFGKAK